MKRIVQIVRFITAIILIIFQQVFIIGIGFLVYSQSSLVVAIIIWCLCIPMLYLNYETYKHIMRYGLINTMAMNADTSELDVPKGKRWYDDNSKITKK